MSTQLQPIPVGPITAFADDRPSWERQPGESDLAWDAFVLFRKMSPHKRSVRAAYMSAVNVGGNWTPENWRRWSVRWKWHDRVDEYDAYVDSNISYELTERRKVALVAAARLGALLRSKAAEAAAALQATIHQTVDGKQVLRSALTPNEIAKLAQIGTELERSALGLGEARGATLGIGAVQLNVNVNQQTQSSDDEILRRAQEVLDAKLVIVDGTHRTAEDD